MRNYQQYYRVEFVQTVFNQSEAIREYLERSSVNLLSKPDIFAGQA